MSEEWEWARFRSRWSWKRPGVVAGCVNGGLYYASAGEEEEAGTLVQKAQFDLAPRSERIIVLSNKRLFILSMENKQRFKLFSNLPCILRRHFASFA